ncbi:MAG: histidine kinase [Bacteroidota bacterium]
MALPASAPAVPVAQPRVVPDSWPHSRTALVVMALWAVPAVIALGQIMIEQTLAGQPVAWQPALWTTLPNWVLWALLTPPVVALAARFGPGTAAPWQIVAVHAAGAAIALGAHALGNVTAFRLAGLPSDWTWATFETHYGLRFHVNVVAYGLVVAATWALLAADRSRQRERREAALRADLAEAELRALQMQVRPHFLFNALHAVGATVRKGEGDRAVTMIGQLGDLLRSSFEADGAAEAPLARELDTLEQYLALEQVRVGDRLTVEWDIDPDARAIRVPAWTLQPLVENAIKYAVATRSGPATIRIRAHVEGDVLRMAVEDDGPGPGASGSGTGVGLANVRGRLTALHGPDARLSLRRGTDGVGTVAEITMPMPASSLVSS